MLHLFVVYLFVCLCVYFLVLFYIFLVPVSASNALKKSIREGPAVVGLRPASHTVPL